MPVVIDKDKCGLSDGDWSCGTPCEGACMFHGIEIVSVRGSGFFNIRCRKSINPEAVQYCANCPAVVACPEGAIRLEVDSEAN